MFMKKTWPRYIISGLSACILCFCIVSAAAQPGEILSVGTEKDAIILYIQDPGGDFEVQCQIGTSEAEKIESHPIKDETVPIETIILLDNSLSVVNKYRPTINTIMSELAANRMNGEQFTIAIFSDQLQYLIQKCADYTEVKQAIDGINYNDQETYLTDVLYSMLSGFNTENSTVLKRIVIISDGVDNKSIGYTKEELYSALEKTPYPIFTIGCTYKNNNEQLKDMFALSRMTGGDSWLLDDVSDPMEIVRGIASLDQAVKVVIKPKAKDCDGTRKGINLVIQSQGQSFTDSVEVTMPFITIPETTVAPTTAAPVETTAATEPVVVQAPVPEKRKIPVFLLAAGCVLSAAVLAGVIVFFRQRQEDKDRFVAAGPKQDTDVPGVGSNTERRVTMMAGANETPKRSTMFVWGGSDAHTFILEDVNNPIKRFEVPLTASILVGYDAECQIRLNYEETVSGKHCRIYSDNGKTYVENLSRSNGTYIDGKRVVGSAEVYTGCVLKLGNLMMRTEIR